MKGVSEGRDSVIVAYVGWKTVKLGGGGGGGGRKEKEKNTLTNTVHRRKCPDRDKSKYVKRLGLRVRCVANMTTEFV